MINKIIDGIAIKLNKEFGDDYSIYTETVEQGLQEPCFFITPVSPKMQCEIKGRYSYTSKFAIDYIPKDDNAKHECNEVLFNLYRVLELIEIQNFNGEKMLVKGTNMDAKLIDDMLHFFVNYDCKIFVAEEIQEHEKMGDIKTIFE